MAYKRQIDRLPIIPKDAKEFNVTCHYCIVGCGYKAYTWPTNKQGGTGADQNKFGVDLAKQQPAETAALVRALDVQHCQPKRQDVHIVIKPDKECVVNSGLGSVRGARMAEMSYSPAAQHRASAADRSDGLALRPDAADQLGRRARPRRARHVAVIDDRARTDCSSPPSTTAAPAAATKTPGAPASSISGP